MWVGADIQSTMQCIMRAIGREQMLTVLSLVGVGGLCVFLFWLLRAGFDLGYVLGWPCLRQAAAGNGWGGPQQGVATSWHMSATALSLRSVRLQLSAVFFRCVVVNCVVLFPQPLTPLVGGMSATPIQTGPT
jgi:hypothetical protein